MRQLAISFILFCLLFLPSFSPLAQAEMSSTNYRITSTAISGGGNVMTSASFRLGATFGQAGANGSSSSDNYAIDSGFWLTLLFYVVGDINGDGDIDLEDVITALRVVTDMDTGSIVKMADADGDGKIGVGEAIKVLHELSE